MKSSEINDSATISCSFSIRRSASLAWRCHGQVFLGIDLSWHLGKPQLQCLDEGALTKKFSRWGPPWTLLLCSSPTVLCSLRKGWKTTFAGAGWLHLSDPYSQSGAVVVAAQLPLRDGQWGNTCIAAKPWRCIMDHMVGLKMFKDVLRWFNHV